MDEVVYFGPLPAYGGRAAVNGIRWQRAKVHAAVLFEFSTFV